MNTLNNILFFVDGAPGQKAALTRAADFARHASASLTIMAVVPKVSTDDERLSGSIQAIQDTLIRERKVELIK
ncbi:MAG: nucleotide-binding universal stress UspA family protein [Candidatus Azotimanducaceae bacterium]|jgi:nucleotide-binding universal stress UspA family protein